ncbi:Undecaprenyl-diphosphatase [Pirellulimonas nuda]|uniref:Undecaprenyl-diphosphatase n=1 Tax=Pirellulimonas nuda TaxID=2528009 RepID=A0A518DIV1_9BACT|nr:undecaprenyl-diphosphate phosphatase [Pirellulimonas nuda]QDU91409.1 Undecaprenyl-diphosphatase [Pirellulimonas nuda]
MSLLEVIVLAVVQGLTEFLPVSSSGHLVVANAVLEAAGYPPAQDLLEVSITLHLGTLLSVLVWYRREILRLFTADRRVGLLVLLATIPAAIVGVWIKKLAPPQVEAQLTENVLLAGCLFPVTALVLLAASRRREGGIDYPEIGWRSALAVGVAQAVAILPGISRSGATIAAGLGVGLRRESAATFAFLLAIPAIAGAGLLEGIEAYKEGTTGTPAYVLAAGFVVSFVVGLAALAALIRFVRSGRLGLFAWYLIPLGVAVVCWRLAG